MMEEDTWRHSPPPPHTCTWVPKHTYAYRHIHYEYTRKDDLVRGVAHRRRGRLHIGGGVFQRHSSWDT